tara:strand:- start:301 stop:1296 length:996 start_codon:yes stop_codon:yes gene_type:complete
MNIFFITTVFFILINISIFFFSQKLIKIFNTYDNPDTQRKFHKKKTSLFGGTIILINCLLFCIINLFFFNDEEYNNSFLTTFIIGCTLFYFLGLYDDKKNLNYNYKFFIELIFIILLIFVNKEIVIDKIYLDFFKYEIYLGKFSFVFTILCFLIFLNAFNMLDGINLQAGLYSLSIFIYLLIISDKQLLYIVLIIALLPFLVLNYKSKVFFGDNGTLLLGFVISYLVIMTAKETNYQILTADKIFVLMMLPGLELIRLFIIRLKLKRHPFSPDRMHIHHIFIKKYGIKKTIIYIQLLSILPIILMNFMTNYIFYIILLNTITYIYLTLDEK